MVTRKSSILGPDGLAVEIATLDAELAPATASGPRAVLSDAVATGLTPERLARILRAAERGDARQYLTLAIEMEERYLHYASQLQTRRLAFDALDVSVTTPDGVDKAIVDFVHELVEAPEFREACAALTDAIGKGYAVVETRWDYERGRLRPVAWAERDQRFFVYDEVALRRLLLLSEAAPRGAPLAPAKFLVHEPQVRGGVPLRRGLARPVAWAYMVHAFSLQDWATFAQIYGVPFRVGRYHAGATDAEKMKLLRALRDIVNDAAAVMPKGMEVEFHAVAAQQGEKVFGALLDYLDRNVSKIVVGQTMTADDGSSLGQAKIHNEVRMDILRADARQMAATVNRDLIRWAVSMNFGPQERYPAVEFPVAEPEDVKALSDAVARLVPLGLKVGQRQLRDKLGLSEPEKRDELLAPPSKAASGEAAGDPPAQLSARGHVAGCRCASCVGRLAASPGDGGAQGGAQDGAEDDGDEIDAVADDALAEWRKIADPLVEPLFALAAEAGSYEELLRRLDALRLDSGPLAAELAKAMATARGIGDVSDLAEPGLPDARRR